MRQTIDHTLTPRLQLHLYLLTGLVLLPHVLHIPLPVSLFLFLTLGWRLASLRLPNLQPNRFLLLLLTIAGVALIYSQHQTLLGRDAGVSLLSIMLVLKTLEVRRRRDLYVTIFIAYFVIVTQFLFDQSLLLLLYLLVLLIGHTSLLLEINRVTPSRNFLEPYRKTFWITLQALPIAIILFILFPRLGQPLWHFGHDSSAQTGLSERVEPGTISQLIQSSAVAFRVTFKHEPPSPEHRYWRGLVLWDTDGVSWYTDKNNPVPILSSSIMPTGKPVEYEILLEPHKKTWLYALDLPAVAPSNSKLSSDFLLHLREPVTRPKQYDGLSFTQHLTSPPTEELRQRALRLGEGITERQRQLVSTWRASSASDSDLVERALQHFHESEFVYTLNPPRYLKNPVDQFLFEDREGFCEHYATAFTQLMRLAGIPSRMVIGYQGGEHNDLGDYYTVRQYDAHAWSEVWLDGKGWKRIDPTAAVAPERVRSAIQPNFGSVGEPALFRIDSDSLIGSGLRQLSMLLDNSSLSWRRWVLGFGQEEQYGLMRGLGLGFLPTGQWGFLLIGLVGLVLALIGVRLVRQGRVKQEQVQVLYQVFCRRMAAIGHPRHAHEGPLDYSVRVCCERPDLANPVRLITKLYIRLRYGEHKTKNNQAAFADQVRRFRPSRS
ncbi:MAG: DUF3488 and transglutaminase-like domain-containing protein [Candidatus Thiodiazotropha sp. (ex Notomyrtea botanica)]|nr:DUF3488 and transglutaminase-like domain-containing protein [Candidatus Thiodiazotropha sp. (ex Notomyrtea botanica)]